MPHYRFTAVFDGMHRDETGEFLIDDARAKSHAVQVIIAISSEPIERRSPPGRRVTL